MSLGKEQQAAVVQQHDHVRVLVDDGVAGLGTQMARHAQMDDEVIPLASPSSIYLPPAKGDKALAGDQTGKCSASGWR